MQEHEEPAALALPEIASRLKTILDEQKLTGTEFAGKMGVPYSTFRAYTSGDRAPSAEFLASVFQTFGYTPQWLLLGAAPKKTGVGGASFEDDFTVVQRLKVTASAGPGKVNGDEAPIGGLCFSRKWLQKRGLNPKYLRVIDISGDSMKGVLWHGDQALMDVGDTTPRTGFPFVLRQGDEIVVKYCQLLPQGILRLSSENPSYPPYDIDLAKADDVEVLGKIVTSTHEW